MKVWQFNDVTEIYSRLTLVAMATKIGNFDTNLSITRLLGLNKI